MEQNKNQNQTVTPNPAPANTPVQIPVKQTLAIPKKFVCEKCKTEIKDSYFFCPHCGKSLKVPPFEFSFFKTLGLIIFSLLFPPLGLVPGIKYLFKKEVTAKIIGVILIVISIVATLAITLFLIKMYNDMTKFYVDLYSQQGGKATYENVTPENVYKQLNSLQQMTR